MAKGEFLLFVKKQELKNQLTNVGTGSNQDISSTIDEGGNSLHVDVSSKVCKWPNKNMYCHYHFYVIFYLPKRS